MCTWYTRTYHGYIGRYPFVMNCATDYAFRIATPFALCTGHLPSVALWRWWGVHCRTVFRCWVSLPVFSTLSFINNTLYECINYNIIIPVHLYSSRFLRTINDIELP